MSPMEKRKLRKISHNIPVLREWLKKNRVSLFMRIHFQERRRNGHQWERSHLGIRRKIFIVWTINQQNLTRGSQDGMGHVLDDLIQVPSPMETWTRWSFDVPSKLGCSVSKWINICPTVFFSPTHLYPERDLGAGWPICFCELFFLLSVPVSIYFCWWRQVLCACVTQKLNLLWPFIHQAICLTTEFPSCCFQFFS